MSLPKCIQYSCIKNNLNCIQNSPKCNGWILMKWKFYIFFEALLKRIRFVDVKKSFSNIRPEPLCSLEIHHFFAYSWAQCVCKVHRAINRENGTYKYCASIHTRFAQGVSAIIKLWPFGAQCVFYCVLATFLLYLLLITHFLELIDDSFISCRIEKASRSFGQSC